MKSLFARAALVGLLALSAACPKPPDPPARFTEPEFGFSFSYPATWKIDDRAGAAFRQHLARSVALDAGMMAELQKQQRELVSLKQTDAQGQIGGRMSVFTAEATPAEFLAGYLSTLFTGMKETPTTEVLERKEGFELGGKRYDVARLSVKVNGATVLQELYVTAVGKQAVMFTLTSKDADKLAQLKAIVSSMTWAAPAPAKP